MKKSFTLIEVLVSILLTSILVYFSIQAYSHLKHISLTNTIRYLALDKIDSELSRLVYAYENLAENAFERNNTNYANTNEKSFIIIEDVKDSSGYNIYKENPLDEDYGLKINEDINNIIEIRNNTGNINEVDENDIVGLLGFRSENLSRTQNVRFGFLDWRNVTIKYTRISLSLTYPYRYIKNDNDNLVLEEYWDYVETLNLKTSARRP